MSWLTFLLPNNSAVFCGSYIFLIITYKELEINIWTVLTEEHRLLIFYSMGLKHLFESADFYFVLL